MRSITVTQERSECLYTLAPEALAPRVLLRASMANLGAAAVVSVWHIHQVAMAQRWLFQHPRVTLRRMQGVRDCPSVANEYVFPVINQWRCPTGTPVIHRFVSCFSGL